MPRAAVTPLPIETLAEDLSTPPEPDTPIVAAEVDAPWFGNDWSDNPHDLPWGPPR